MVSSMIYLIAFIALAALAFTIPVAAAGIVAGLVVRLVWPRARYRP